jgi:AcrR family transcriptional regulator
MHMIARAKRQRLKDPHTRAKLLAAAQQVFTEKGYAGASTRDIAALAGVSSTLMFRYFESKASLFETMLVDVAPVEIWLSGVQRHEFGRQLAKYVLDQKIDAMSIFTYAMTMAEQQAGEVAIQVTSQRSLEPLAKWLGPPNARVRALQIIMLGSGFQLYARRLPLLPSAVGENKPLAKWFADSVQAIVDGS